MLSVHFTESMGAQRMLHSQHVCSVYISQTAWVLMKTAAENYTTLSSLLTQQTWEVR